MSNQNINIRRPYFKRDKYGQVIDNSFQQPGDISVTGSVGDFYSNYLSLLLSMTPEQHALFYSGSIPFAELDQTNLSASEVERLRALVSESRENKEIKNDNTPRENPVVPNGSFFRRGGALIDGDKVRLRNGIFYYVQEGIVRKCESAEVFLSLFKSVTSLNPYNKDVLKDNVPYIENNSFITFFPKGKDITKDDLGSESYETEQDTQVTPPVIPQPPVEDEELIIRNPSPLPSTNDTTENNVPGTVNQNNETETWAPGLEPT